MAVLLAGGADAKTAGLGRLCAFLSIGKQYRRKAYAQVTSRLAVEDLNMVSGQSKKAKIWYEPRVQIAVVRNDGLRIGTNRNRQDGQVNACISHHFLAPN